MPMNNAEWAALMPNTAELITIGVVALLCIVAWVGNRAMEPYARRVPSWLALLIMVAVFFGIGLIGGAL